MNSDLIKVAADLRTAADEMEAEGQNGWPNACRWAAEAIDAALTAVGPQGGAVAVGELINWCREKEDAYNSVLPPPLPPPP